MTERDNIAFIVTAIVLFGSVAFGPIMRAAGMFSPLALLSVMAVAVAVLMGLSFITIRVLS